MVMMRFRLFGNEKRHEHIYSERLNIFLCIQMTIAFGIEDPKRNKYSFASHFIYRLLLSPSLVLSVQNIVLCTCVLGLRTDIWWSDAETKGRIFLCVSFFFFINSLSVDIRMLVLSSTVEIVAVWKLKTSFQTNSEVILSLFLAIREREFHNRLVSCLSFGAIAHLMSFFGCRRLFEGRNNRSRQLLCNDNLLWSLMPTLWFLFASFMCVFFGRCIGIVWLNRPIVLPKRNQLLSLLATYGRMVIGATWNR